VGGDRFRLLDVVVGDDPPYLQGKVEWLADEEAAADGAAAADEPLAPLVRGVRDLFLEYVAEVAALGVGRDDIEVATMLKAVADDAAGLSWLVASSALLTAEDRQELLAESATRRRLRTEARMLRRELTLLQSIGAVPVPLQQFATPMTVN
jgi:Lon protease-like protein